MRRSKSFVERRASSLLGVVLLLIFIAIALSGCPALIVPSLAYQGYKAIHQSGTTTASAKSSHHGASTSQRSSVAGDHSVE